MTRSQQAKQDMLARYAETGRSVDEIYEAIIYALGDVPSDGDPVQDIRALGGLLRTSRQVIGNGLSALPQLEGTGKGQEYLLDRWQPFASGVAETLDGSTVHTRPWLHD